MIRSLSFSALLCALLLPAGAAEQPSPVEAKMREQLRATMLQLRTAETEKANLQAAQADMEQKSKELTEQVEALTKQLAEDKTKADKSIADLNDKVAKQEGDIVQLRESLDKWKTSHAKVVTIAQTKESERAKFEAKSLSLEQKVADQTRRNDSMYKLGVEVLNRYEKFGLGDALTAREPFVGITRVKFENLIQDYSDKLADSRIKPDPAAAPAPTEEKDKAKAKKGAKPAAATPAPAEKPEKRAKTKEKAGTLS